MGRYLAGQVTTITATFTTPGTGVEPEEPPTYVDPTNLTFKWWAPGASATIYVYGTDAEIVRQSQGVFSVDIDTTTLGIAGAITEYRYEWQSTGDGQAVGSGTFFVTIPPT